MAAFMPYYYYVLSLYVKTAATHFLPAVFATALRKHYMTLKTMYGDIGSQISPFTVSISRIMLCNMYKFPLYAYDLVYRAKKTSKKL